MENKNIHEYLKYKLQINDHDNPPLRGKLKTSRDDLAVIFADLNYTVGAEIGVRKGYYSIELLTRNPNMKLYCIDPWGPYGRTSQEKQDRFFRSTQGRLSLFPNVVFIRKTSMDALADIPDGSLDFVYIDGLHDFDNVIMDIVSWSKKVRSGGIVSGHDYFYNFGVGVVYAVDAYVRAHNIQQWFVTKEVLPSFLWVKS